MIGSVAAPLSLLLYAAVALAWAVERRRVRLRRRPARAVTVSSLVSDESGRRATSAVQL